MKNILFAGIFLLLIYWPAEASEIFGKISTNPGALSNTTTSGNSNQAISTGQTEKKSDNSNKQAVKNIKKPPVNSSTKNSGQNKAINKNIKVLGVSFYPENSLLRADGRRIFIIRKGCKKRILSLKDLRKYAGQTIFNVTSKELAQYRDRPNLEGELIREKGQSKIFVIFQGKKKPITSLAELRSKYCNLEVSNISHEELGLY